MMLMYEQSFKKPNLFKISLIFIKIINIISVFPIII
jgi:hypothetical protein